MIATDPGAMKDFQHFCKATGDTLESAVEEDNVLTFIIRKTNGNLPTIDRLLNLILNAINHS